jgi:glutamine synthetase
MYDALAKWVEANSGLRDAYIGLCDIHGIWRGKLVPLKKLEKLKSSPIRIPVSAVAVDVWGNDVPENPLFYRSGDMDGICPPTGRLPIVIPSEDSTVSAMLPVWQAGDDGAPHPVDPRGALAQAKQRCEQAGLTPVVGTELEFYLLSPATALEAATSPHSQRPFATASVLSVDDLQAIQPFLDDVFRISELNGIAPDASVSEGGPGQFEIAITHGGDVLKAADDFLFLKYILRHTARKHGFSACFMAKPFPDLAGNGLHVHCSLLDADGRNVFASGAAGENEMLRHVVGGLLDALVPSTLIFAPHLNSYRRFANNSLAPTSICWGIENRTSAIRIPDASPNARRIEHRVAGADANPYLVLAVILNAMMDGIERRADPGPPLATDAYRSDHARIPSTWTGALVAFEQGEVSRPLLDPLLARSIVLCKRQEIETFAARMTEFEIETYRGTV